MADCEAPLVEYVLLVHLVDKNGKRVPQVRESHPVPPSVGMIDEFCFPYTECDDKEHRSTFIVRLTESNGVQHFAYIKRLLCAQEPLAICLVSTHAFLQAMPQVLDHLAASFLEASGNFAVLHAAIDRLCAVVPRVGAQQEAPVLGDVCVPPLRAGAHLLDDVSAVPLFRSLYVSHIISVLAALLFERRVIMLSNDVERLSRCAFAALSLLQPFSWQHVFIAVLPAHLLDYCSAPMPFLIGVHTRHTEQLRQLPLEEVVFVHLDENAVNLCYEDMSVLPHTATDRLRDQLDQLVRTARKASRLDPRRLRRAFLNFFVPIFCRYLDYFQYDVPNAGEMGTGGTQTGIPSARMVNAGERDVAAGRRAAQILRKGVNSIVRSTDNLKSLGGGGQPRQQQQRQQQQQQQTPKSKERRDTVTPQQAVLQFHCDAFIAAQRSRSVRRFLRTFCQTQMWSAFVQRRLSGEAPSTFDEACGDFCQRLLSSAARPQRGNSAPKMNISQLSDKVGKGLKKTKAAWKAAASGAGGGAGNSNREAADALGALAAGVRKRNERERSGNFDFTSDDGGDDDDDESSGGADDDSSADDGVYMDLGDEAGGEAPAGVDGDGGDDDALADTAPAASRTLEKEESLLGDLLDFSTPSPAADTPTPAAPSQSELLFSAFGHVDLRSSSPQRTESLLSDFPAAAATSSSPMTPAALSHFMAASPPTTHVEPDTLLGDLGDMFMSTPAAPTATEKNEAPATELLIDF